MCKIITVSGKARCGKNTLADFLKEELESNDYRVGIIAYADYVKLLAKTLYNWDGNKDEKGRTLLQTFGTDIVRSVNSNFWVSIVEQTINILGNEFDYFIIPDARFENEIEYLREKGYDLLSIYIERANFKSNLTSEQLQHASETGIDKTYCDLHIVNGDLESLRIKTKEIINSTK